MSKSSGNRGIVIVLLVALFGGAALAFYVKQYAVAIPKAEPIVQHTSVNLKGTPSQPRASTPASEQVYLPSLSGDNVTLSKTTTSIPSGVDAMQFVAESVINSIKLDGAKVLGVDVRDHVAVVNFNSHIKDGMGSSEEGQFLKSLQVGFGQFRDIDKVWINVDGQSVDSIGEHVEVVDPIPVIRPFESAPAESDQAKP